MIIVSAARGIAAMFRTLNLIHAKFSPARGWKKNNARARAAGPIGNSSRAIKQQSQMSARSSRE